MWRENSTSDDVAPNSSTAPITHKRSTHSLAPISTSTNDNTSCGIRTSVLLNDTSTSDVDNSLLPSNSSQPWTSAMAIFEKEMTTTAATTTTDADGYFTAHASMISLTPENSENRKFEGMAKPTNFGDAPVFVSILSPNRSNLHHLESSSTPSSQSGDVCRICHGENSIEIPLISPCNCSGSMKFVHQECIQTWLKSSRSLSCELCRFTYLTGTKVKPFRQWKALELTLLERWKIVCCVMIQLFAICYFVLSVEALVRAAKDFHVPQAAMWLWIKIIMSVFGVTVSLACTVRQCKTFVRLFRRLEMFNRIVYVKDRTEVAPEGTSAGRTLLGGQK